MSWKFSVRSAYESAFSVRWLIQEQIKGDPRLNYDPAKGAVRSPLLLWQAQAGRCA